MKNSMTHQLDDRMESFFLAETIKYLYLLFDPDNVLLKPSPHIHRFPDGDECLLGAGESNL